MQQPKDLNLKDDAKQLSTKLELIQHDRELKLVEGSIEVHSETQLPKSKITL